MIIIVVPIRFITILILIINVMMIIINYDCYDHTCNSSTYHRC